MQPFQCDLQAQVQETHRITHAGTTEQPLVAKHRGGTKRPQPQPPHTRGTFPSPAAATLHGKTQGFVPRLPPHNTEHATFMQPFPFVTTSHPHHFPSSPLPFVTTSLRHHFPRSPLPFVTTLCHSLLFFCDVLLWDVKSQTTLCHSLLFFCDVLLCDVKSHTTLCHSLLFFCDVLLCDAKDTHHPSSMSNLTILFVRNTEVLLPNFLW